MDSKYGGELPNYGPETPAPDLNYRPALPRNRGRGIGLIGCGGISKDHLTAYRAAGFNVVVLCDLSEERARSRRAEFFPNAEITTDYRHVLGNPQVEVVDVTTHPAERLEILESALQAKRHVLSQKPFVQDLEVGRRLVELAKQQQVLLAVNQNGRWAPHLAYLRECVLSGWLGELCSSHVRVHWDHSWVANTPFEDVFHLILFDFAIHWFDFICTLKPDEWPTRVYASMSRAPGQRVRPALQGQALLEFPDFQASLVFDGSTRFGQWDATYLVGTEGTAHSYGPDLKVQSVRLFGPAGQASPQLLGTWFPDAFQGPMGELLLAIEEGRQPSNSAENNLKSLAVCFAALHSAETGQAVVPGTVTVPRPGR